ncbi:multidrug resistance protein MdtN [Weeksella virosa]|uniref:Efflux transporter, RND family, MFP subunit n=1 Tax=Weeksella virosa (strain ATCC 43766 / DSM 16922 / JCM 21250 / CCUG 30538 / CDC 9751 / IAM 14551 / NBRC 16016 / NCTC 11634 / CL345/78) TaxID=865938 RepID=F0P1R4_WEEVC|nr:efflux RND transporter periplasmic adaptor subunit [Weeksella virosa]ADX68711.1 efflux transporter, RND family, MFP subunit [Weeksella virosa DSM 16922]MDK7675851.1 efflux RND transporter periplasmic adaptor subunit [Weeksella virosa]SUP55061.1 multidrug resistance protein MdtN [Weeksella virosa]VEH63618.1 multidrug resistance protein MdtN [Weeksella virosa]
MKNYIWALIIGMNFSACTSQKEENKTLRETENTQEITLTQAQQKQLTIETVKVETIDLNATMQLSARTQVLPQDRISVTHMLGGFVKSIQVIPGTYVKKGQVLAVLEDPMFVQIQEEYLTTKALLEKAESNFKRQKELNEAQAASTKILEEAQADRKLLLIKKRALEEKLHLMHLSPNSVTVNAIKRNLTVVSPVSGAINKVSVNRGQYVSASEPLLEIIQSSTPLLEIKAFENQLAALKIGQKILASTNQNPEQKYEAKVISIGQEVNSDGSVNVLAQLSNPLPQPLISQMYFTVELTVANQSAQVLPEGSVVHFEGKDYVYEVLSNNTYKMKKVKIGKAEKNKIAIITPLNPTQNYVSKGAYALLMAMKNTEEEE